MTNEPEEQTEFTFLKKSHHLTSCEDESISNNGFVVSLSKRCGKIFMAVVCFLELEHCNKGLAYLLKFNEDDKYVQEKNLRAEPRCSDFRGIFLSAIIFHD